MSGNRFSDLMNAAKSKDSAVDAQTSKHSDAENDNQTPLKVTEEKKPKRQSSKKNKPVPPKAEKQESERPNVQTSKLSNIQTSESLSSDNKVTKVGKRSDPNFTKTTLYLPKSLHKQLKRKALDMDQDMSEIIVQFVIEGLAKDG